MPSCSALPPQVRDPRRRHGAVGGHVDRHRADSGRARAGRSAQRAPPTRPPLPGRSPSGGRGAGVRRASGAGWRTADPEHADHLARDVDDGARISAYARLGRLRRRTGPPPRTVRRRRRCRRLQRADRHRWWRADGSWRPSRARRSRCARGQPDVGSRSGMEKPGSTPGSKDALGRLARRGQSLGGGRVHGRRAELRRDPARQLVGQRGADRLARRRPSRSTGRRARRSG